MSDDVRAPKPASEHTVARNRAAVLSFDDDLDFAAANRGLVAQHPTGKVGDGWVAWDTANHDFLRTGEPAPDTVHPGLWRQGQLNAIHGLFEVAPDVWQARGYDISNVTFIAGRDGWVIIDPLTTEQTAAACLQLANDTLGERPVTAVIYTHSHVDHFGGVLGVTTQDAVDAGDVRVIAPEGFLHEAVSENGTAGPIMMRRALYQFGPLLQPGPTGIVNAGLGMGLPIGASDLIAPTEIIDRTGMELDVDGVRIVFQNTPDAEAPSEMNFFFPDHRLLCLAENCTHTLHNLYPLRGAKARDALAWSKYIQEALVLWGDHSDVMFASHHWPRFGTDDVKKFMRLQRDVYRWMHDQTLRLANHGFSMTEIANMLDQPDAFASDSHVRGYYGTVSHNVRSVYNRYLGWYDGNPASLNPLPPADAGARYVELMGGPDAVIAAARTAAAEGDERWAVQLLRHVVDSDSANEAARLASADAMEQLGYQAESSTWRNAYLFAAWEMRHGSLEMGRVRPSPVVKAMTGEQLVEALGVRFDPARCRASASMAWTITDHGDGGEIHLIGVEHAAVHHRADPPADLVAAAEVRVTLTHGAWVDLMNEPEGLAGQVDAGTITVDGDRTVLDDFVGALDVFESMKVIEPNER